MADLGTELQEMLEWLDGLSETDPDKHEMKAYIYMTRWPDPSGAGSTATRPSNAIGAVVMRETDWSAIEHFDDWESALAWALEQRAAGGPKYLVRWVGRQKWEVIQAWLWFM
jgi:hypothetical protein